MGVRWGAYEDLVLEATVVWGQGSDQLWGLELELLAAPTPSQTLLILRICLPCSPCYKQDRWEGVGGRAGRQGCRARDLGAPD